MKRTFSSLLVFILLSLGMVSCGGSSATTTSSGLTYRAFISNPSNLNLSGTISPALNIVDATQDILSFASVDLTGTTTSAGMMVETPIRDHTIVFSPATGSSANNQVAIVDNAKESASGSVTLPGPTESMFVAADNKTLYAAIPTAPENGLPAGAVVQIDTTAATPAITATVPIAGAHFLTQSPSGNQILVVSDTANTVSVFTPTLISQGNTVTTITGFDKPVWAIFSADGSTAYVLNCGPECGGTAASVAVLNMATMSISSTVPVPAATMGLLVGSTLYVAGTPLTSGVDCQANLCGVLTVLSTSDLTATPSTYAITDGYHDQIVMGQNGQLFIGSRTCTNLVGGGSTPGRGCLSLLNTADGFIYTAVQNGDVTAIQPIEGRSVVYVCEGGGLQIYDTNYDLGNRKALALQTTQVVITGQAIDVKLADFPNGNLITK